MGGVDKAKDKAEQLKGHVKEKIGDATDNERLENEGRAEKLKGKAKEKAHDLREEADDKLHEGKERLMGRGSDDEDR
ncbi:CsbD family protein [Glycomyces luteolus]|uniref:CsbD family protein n=1 Tax=Glycomyces luteolus TaxID=2670330 RepID=A0A9X3PAW7_9ACTN|nr:CsbD family protein [Glycomyces luteolus]MDA1360706.1 CsbD family protein [Glycomyces luteolus]